MTQYLYDAEGNRIAKGGGSFTCVTSSTTPSTFAQRTWSILDGAGQQMTEMDYGSGQWQWSHSNVFAGSKLLATYCAAGTAYCDTQTPTTFALSDWLGTKRVQATASGIIDNIGSSPAVFPSLPYGDQAPTAPLGASEHFFTGKERDAESGNDYFGARYYASTMGRFLSPDAPVDQHPENPQSWNLYSYVRNNPLRSIDQDGNYDCGQMTADQCTQFGNNLAAAQNQLATAHDKGTITDDQFKQGSDAFGAYGTLNDHNGVTVNVGATAGYPGTTTVSDDGTVSGENPTGQNIQVTFNPGVFSGNSDALNGVIGHEGSHVEDGEAWAKSGFSDAANPTHFDTEFKAYGVTSIFGAAQGAQFLMGTKPGENTQHLIWDRSVPGFFNDALRTTMIKTLYPNWAEKAFEKNTNPEKK